MWLCCLFCHEGFHGVVSSNPVCYKAWNARVICCLQPFEDPQLSREGKLLSSSLPTLCQREEVQTAQFQFVWDGPPCIWEEKPSNYLARNQPQDMSCEQTESRQVKLVESAEGGCLGGFFGLCVCTHVHNDCRRPSHFTLRQGGSPKHICVGVYPRFELQLRNAGRTPRQLQFCRVCCEWRSCSNSISTKGAECPVP